MSKPEKENVSNLDKLLTLRESQYQFLTKRILDTYELLLEKVVNILLNRKCKVDWEVIDKFPHSIKGKFVNVIGTIRLAIGEKVDDDGKEVIITKENIKSFTKIIKFTVPLKLLEFGTAIQITNYLVELNEKQRVTPYDDFLDYLENYDGTDVENILKIAEIENNTPLELTEQQVENLRIYETSGQKNSKTKH